MIVTGGTGVTAVISLVFAVHVGRVLGPAEYADFGAAVALSALLSLALGPINQTVARFTAQYAARGEFGKIRTLCREIARRAVVVGVVVLAVSALTVPAVTGLLHVRSAAPILLCYGLVFLTLLLSIPRGVLRGAQSYGQYNVNIITESLTRLAAGSIMLWLLASAAAGVSGYLAGVTAALVVSFAQLRRIWGEHGAQSVDGQAVRRFAGPMFILALGSGGFLFSDILLVKHFFSGAEAGVYVAASTLAGSINVVVTPFHVILLPLLMSLQESGARIRGPFLRICLYLFLIAGSVIAVFALWPGLLKLLYGAQYAGGAAFLPWLTLARLLTHLASMVVTVPIARSDFRFLSLYLLTLAVEITAMLIWHDTLRELIVALLIAKCLTLGALTVFVLSRRGTAPGVVAPAGTSG